MRLDTTEESQKQNKKRKRRKQQGPRRWLINLWVAVSLLGIMAIVAGGAGFYVWNSLQPTSKGEAKEITITRGMSANSVADLLEENGIIKNGFVFSYYLQLKDEGSRFQAGTYQLSPGMDNASIIAKLNAGDTIKEETIKFTIPEGLTVLQIADKLAAEGIVDKTKFLELAETSRAWGDAETVRSIPENAALHKRLEGYLFPETYEMKKGSTEEDILIRMLTETDRKLGALPDDWQAALEASGRTMHEILTIASLVEREVVVDEERALVAGVIYNRLQEPMRLQIDATVQYALDAPKEVLSLSDLEIDSPYNTYKIDGLPPGPIASPSLASIEAALYPADTNYLFYVTKKDGSQTHLFAETFKEHQRNIAKSEQAAQ
ncbi:endolytic transglycosylase MltG [Paenibacillus soyae]|uniref:Endolytic murein transglycosylase n=1 Tax=Paenibacillus soyae TaxID=2969249 RepID=A0A9X2MR27_9BACL|nr:endolytic transglycosylase MltG [Paenibacillus soyae]MCR2804820.1 endolytic transglycosylase MltG [Paenibacillus soyae]